MQTLIIDDDPVFSGYLVGLLEAAGIENIVCFGDAQTTLAQESVNKFSRIICDLNMPNMDGIEFITYLATQSWYGELIIVSGEARGVISAASRLANLSGLKVAGTLRKPINLADLERVLSRSPSPVSQRGNPNDDISRNSDIKRAVSRLNVMPVYQAQLNLKTMEIDGIEALMRLRLEDGSLVLPKDFFGLLSDDTADQLALKHNELVLRDFANGCGSHSQIRCSINMGANQVAKGYVTDRLIENCKQLSIDPAKIIIEVTETEPLIEAPNLIGAMSRLRIAGFGLALDDFGSGHANIQELGWFPFTEIKTDLIFGQNLLEDRFSRAVIEFAVKAANQLDLELTVEGLEHADAASLAAKLGAHRGQGYAIARPAPWANMKRLAMAS